MIRASITALAAVSLLALGASAQPGPGGMRPPVARNVFCPPQVAVKFVPNAPIVLAASGWKANEGPFQVQLDPANPPRLSGGNLVCYYKLLNQPGVFNIYQPLGNQKCSPMSNGAGFVCAQ